MGPRMEAQVGNYTLLQRLNEGGTAEVFLATSRAPESPAPILAVKRMRRDLCADPSFVSMFLEEAKLAIALLHPNVVRTFELGRVGHDFFVCMEYVAGRSLRQVVERAQETGMPLPPAMCLFIAVQICEGLAYAHRRNEAHGAVRQPLLHRDLTPHNIMISYGGGVKITDFAVAKAAGQSARTRDVFYRGKFGYVSPEQARGRDLDERSDLFSVGVVLFEMLTGQRLFAGTSDLSVLDKVREAEVYPPTTLVAGIHPEVEALVLQALRLLPEERFASAAEMRDALSDTMVRHAGYVGSEDLATLMGTLFANEKQAEERMLGALGDGALAKTQLEVVPIGTAVAGDVTVHRPRQPGWTRHFQMTARFRGSRLLRSDRFVLGTAAALAIAMVAASWFATRLPAPLQMGTLELLTDPTDAWVLIDGVAVGRTPFRGNELTQGKHTVTLEHTGFASVSRYVRIEAHRTVRLQITLPPQRHTTE